MLSTAWSCMHRMSATARAATALHASTSSLHAATFNIARWIHPVVFPSPPPTLLLLRCSKYTCRRGGGIWRGSRPPRACNEPSMPQYERNLSVSAPSDAAACASDISFAEWSADASCSKKAATSWPMPPAPTKATRCPTLARFDRTST